MDDLRQLNKFYTKSDVSKKIVDYILNKYNNKYQFIEPSAGNGSFLQYLPKNTLSFDIKPESKEIIKQDFLSLKLEDIERYKLGDLIDLKNNDFKELFFIGNPPFGKNNSLAIKFFNHCCKLNAKYIGFILPKSFGKISIQDRLNLNYRLIKTITLSPSSFIINEISYSVPCLFQLWKKSKKNRETSITYIPNKYSFIKFENINDDSITNIISFRRVGGNAGMFSKDTNKSKESHYFIKFNSDDIKLTDELLSDLNKINWEKYTQYSTGPKSISKNNLVYELNLFIESVIIENNNQERQNHGFIYEDYICEKYNLLKSKNYTSEYDAYFNIFSQYDIINHIIKHERTNPFKPILGTVSKIHPLKDKPFQTHIRSVSKDTAFEIENNKKEHKPSDKLKLSILDYNKKTVKELKILCKENKIRCYSKLKKQKIIELLFK